MFFRRIINDTHATTYTGRKIAEVSNTGIEPTRSAAIIDNEPMVCRIVQWVGSRRPIFWDFGKNDVSWGFHWQAADWLAARIFTFFTFCFG
jgi:hypothetical protein